ncbi:MAG: hypothetical protein U0V74_10570 [Chitinophagales bacterium]
MKLNYIKLALACLGLVLLNFAGAQSIYEGDALSSYLGKAAGSQELKDLKANYSCEMANDEHYLSKGGIELILRNGSLNEMHLYRKSAVYGAYKGKLPNKLQFDMLPSEVKRLLGKPVVSYNSGYCEFDLGTYIVSCWFDSGRLDQVGVAMKGAL